MCVVKVACVCAAAALIRGIGGIRRLNRLTFESPSR
jgi:hypothetical protein